MFPLVLFTLGQVADAQQIATRPVNQGLPAFRLISIVGPMLLCFLLILLIIGLLVCAFHVGRWSGRRTTQRSRETSEDGSKIYMAQYGNLAHFYEDCVLLNNADKKKLQLRDTCTRCADRMNVQAAEKNK